MNIQSIHFIDIETVSLQKDLQPDNISFMKKFKHEVEQELGQSIETVPYPQIIMDRIYKQKASLYAEFGKIVCVSLGKLQGEKFFIKSIVGESEHDILTQLNLMLENGKVKPQVLAGHNILEFDVPFLTRRFLINGIGLPSILNNFDRKPWETPYRDTMKMWSSTQWNYKVSLNLLAELFGLPSPKESMEGKDVADLFYSSDPERMVKIANYCSGDVFTTANVYCKMTGQPLILESQIERL